MIRIIPLALRLSLTLTPFIRNSIIYNFATKQVAGSDKLKQYEHIKDKTNSKTKIHLDKHRCEGCNALLQSQDNSKYGFVKKDIYDSAIANNTRLLRQTYGLKVENMDSRIFSAVKQIQNQLDVTIINRDTGQFESINDMRVLLRLQQIIDKIEEQDQSLHRTKSRRSQIFCYRCYTLKYHNRLPDEYDVEDKQLGDMDLLLNKMFHKHRHGGTYFLYLVDVMDIAGSLNQKIFNALLKNMLQTKQRAQSNFKDSFNFSIIVNKLDVLNQKYINKHYIQQEVRRVLIGFVNQYNQTEEVLKINPNQINIFLVSSVSKAGIKSLQKLIQKYKFNRIQLVGLPNTGKTTILNELGKLNKPVSKVPGTTTYITEHKVKKSMFFDMPGVYCKQNLYNLIDKPNLKALLTWNKKYSPPSMLHSAFFFGGKVECKDVRIILFGLGGACSSDNRWFMLNYKQFWKGLPELNSLNITRYQRDLQFVNGKADDLQIFGWGFISFRLSQPGIKFTKKKVIFYLPKDIRYNFRSSVLKDSEVIHYKSATTKRHRLQRVHEAKMNKSKLQKMISQKRKRVKAPQNHIQ